MTNHFNTFHLGDITEIIAGGDKPKNFSLVRTSSKNVPVFANAEKDKGLQGYTDIPRITDSAVTMAARGSNVGFVALRKEPYFPIVRLLSLIPHRELLDVDYLYYNLKQNRKTGTGSGQPQITIPDISSRTISLPPISLQKKLAKVLLVLDEKIEINNKINSELEAMAKLIYDYWFVQFDFPDAKGKPYKSSGGKMVYNEELKREIPEDWSVDVISNIISVKDGTHDSPKPHEAGYPLITSKHLKPEGLDFGTANLISAEDYEKVNKRSKVETGDILFSMIGSIGEIYRVDEIEINFAIKNVGLYKSSEKTELTNFIYMFLKSYDMQRYMGNVTSGSIQKFIGLNALRRMPILLKEEVIKEYVEKTKHIFEKKSLIKKENGKLREIRDWLLPMLMNGQVTIR